MTLDELLQEIRDMIALGEVRPSQRRILQATLDMLGEAQPCGMVPPTCSARGEVHVLDDYGREMANFGTPSDARAYAAAILRTADAIDGGAK